MNQLLFIGQRVKIASRASIHSACRLARTRFSLLYPANRTRTLQLHNRFGISSAYILKTHNSFFHTSTLSVSRIWIHPQSSSTKSNILNTTTSIHPPSECKALQQVEFQNSLIIVRSKTTVDDGTPTPTQAESKGPLKEKEASGTKIPATPSQTPIEVSSTNSSNNSSPFPTTSASTPSTSTFNASTSPQATTSPFPSEPVITKAKPQIEDSTTSSASPSSISNPSFSFTSTSSSSATTSSTTAAVTSFKKPIQVKAVKFDLKGTISLIEEEMKKSELCAMHSLLRRDVKIVSQICFTYIFSNPLPTYAIN